MKLAVSTGLPAQSRFTNSASTGQGTSMNTTSPETTKTSPLPQPACHYDSFLRAVILSEPEAVLTHGVEQGFSPADQLSKFGALAPEVTAAAKADRNCTLTAGLKACSTPLAKC